MNQKVFVTDNLKLAMALTAAGFSLQHGENVAKLDKDGKPTDESYIVCELDAEHNGISANYLRMAFENQVDLETRVNEIVEARGITQEEYVILAFDAARAGLHNRSTVLFCSKRKRALVAIKMKDGRSLIYREGTPKDKIRQLIENA